MGKDFDSLEMSAATRTLLRKAQRMVPPMLAEFHKGQLGRVGVIGGSRDYTGAPYFSAMASAKLGCDMSHVICTPAAGAVIKTYSPNLMVHLLMQESDSTNDNAAGTQEIINLLARLHVLVVGPGLGRDPLMHDTVKQVLREARYRKMPVVVDADALSLVPHMRDVFKGWREAVLTPNVVEFERLWKGFGLPDMGPGAEKVAGTSRLDTLARILGGVTIVQKGQVDYVSKGEKGKALKVDLEGGRKRSGGQGDTLTGCIATLLAWREGYLDGLWEHEPLDVGETMGLAVFAGCCIARECSRLAFTKLGRSMQASDLTEEVHKAFMTVLGEAYEDDEQDPVIL